MSLYLVSTPIGNLGDITLRALETLKSVDSILCEDTRVSAKLLSHFSIKKKLLIYDDYHAEKMRPKVIKDLKGGKKIALISDAGTPLVSDPGYKLVECCYENDIECIAIPGANAVLPALIISTFPPYPFVFCGFVGKNIEIWNNTPATLVFFESAKRLLKTLNIMQEKLPNRKVCVARELTKKYEEKKVGTYDSVIEYYTNNPPRGEIVIVLDHPKCVQTDDEKIEEIIEQHKTEKKTDIVKKICQNSHLKRDEAYDYLLKYFSKKLT